MASRLPAHLLALLAILAQLSSGWLHTWDLESEHTAAACTHIAASPDNESALCGLTPHQAHQVRHHDGETCPICQVLAHSHQGTPNAARFTPPAPLVATLGSAVFAIGNDRVADRSAARAPPVLL